MIVSIHQPQYLPWLGYFDKIDRADVFVLLDTVQYKKNEWQNRNRIKTARGAQWLTVPVTYRYPQLICEVGVNGRRALAAPAAAGPRHELPEGAPLGAPGGVLRGDHLPVVEDDLGAQHPRGEAPGRDPGH